MNIPFPSGTEDPATQTALTQTALYPQESLQAVKTVHKQLFIGLPKEHDMDESRLVLTPEATSILVRNGIRVCVETGAGENAKFTDQAYSDAGAAIVYSAKEAFEADVVLKVEPPTDEEINYLKPGRTLISALQTAKLTKDYVEALGQRKVTALAFELIQDKVGGMPVVRAMSEIAGNTVMLIAAEYLNSANKGRGIILGGITGVPPTKVVVLGSGTVAEYAARTAIGMGAEIKVFDRYIYRLRRLKYAVGQQIHTSTLETDLLAEAISRADVVVGAMRPEEGRSPIVVTEEMVAAMKRESVIIDVSIDQGGCFETSEITTHRNPTFRKHDIIHYCVPNIASRVAHTATMALSHIFTPYLLEMGALGGVEEMMFRNKWFMRGIYTYKGSVTNAHIARKFNLPHKDLNLLMAARL